MRVIVSHMILRTMHETLRRAECAECGLDATDALVELGYDSVIQLCLPCLKRAVAEAEAAVAKDKA